MTAKVEVASMAGRVGAAADLFLAGLLRRRLWRVADADADLDISGPRDLLLRNGSNAQVALRIRVGANAGVLVQVYEAPSLTSFGTALTSYNADRNATGATDVSASHTPTVISVGTQVAAGYAGVGYPADIVLVLKPQATYLVRNTAKADNSTVTTALEWLDDGSGSANTETTTTTSTSTTTTTTTTTATTTT